MNCSSGVQIEYLSLYPIDKQLSANKMGIKKVGVLVFTAFLIPIFVHRNARMTEEIRRIFEVSLAFADNAIISL